MNRRVFSTGLSALLAGACKSRQEYKLNYILSSCMYGYMPLDEILPEVKKTGASAIDIWCRIHGNQREQINEMGFAKFSQMLKKHGVKLGGFTQYPLGPFRLQQEMENVKALGGDYVLCAATGPKEPTGEKAREAVKVFLEKMKAHTQKAKELGLNINIENHSNLFLYHPDSIYAFAELNPFDNIKVAFAPHHLYKWVAEMPSLIRALGKHIGFFYAQEHGKGSYRKMSKRDEMLQMPGFGGGLDYRPLVRALKDINYTGYLEIFMHPFPRGLPILPAKADITAAINKSRVYLDACLL